MTTMRKIINRSVQFGDFLLVNMYLFHSLLSLTSFTLFTHVARSLSPLSFLTLFSSHSLSSLSSLSPHSFPTLFSFLTLFSSPTLFPHFLLFPRTLSSLSSLSSLSLLHPRYMLFGFFLLTNIVLAMVYDSFTGTETRRFKRNFLHKRRGIRLAWERVMGPATTGVRCVHQPRAT
jgi:hypothetical protein